MLIMLFNLFFKVMACLIILLRSRVGHPRVNFRFVVTLWRRWSF